MKATLIDAVLDWQRQRVDFEPDGSLRDIYIQGATVEDWRTVVTLILEGGYRARLQCGGVAMPMPSAFETLFGDPLTKDDCFYMSFTVGDVLLDCHFFDPTEIEFSFWPAEVTERSLHDLLAFMIDVGDAVGKPVIMTCENVPAFPIYTFDPGGPPSSRRLVWRG